MRRFIFCLLISGASHAETVSIGGSISKRINSTINLNVATEHTSKDLEVVPAIQVLLLKSTKLTLKYESHSVKRADNKLSLNLDLVF